MKKHDLSALFKSKKTVAALVIAALAGALILFFSPSESKNQPVGDENAEYIKEAENKIKQTVGAICGGDVYVIVTLEYGKETQYAKNTAENSEQTVTSSGAPVVTRTAAPVIRGISVVCKGGSDPVIRQRITEALSCAYGISSARIYVAPAGR